MKSHDVFQGNIIVKNESEKHWGRFKILFSITTGQISTKLGFSGQRCVPWVFFFNISVSGYFENAMRVKTLPLQFLVMEKKEGGVCVLIYYTCIKSNIFSVVEELLSTEKWYWIHVWQSNIAHGNKMYGLLESMTTPNWKGVWYTCINYTNSL